MEPILEIKNLEKNYTDFNFGSVNLTIPRGCIMGLIGENGAGKTTLIKLILNLIHHDAGEIKVFGKDNIMFEKEIKEDLGVVLDECTFPENLNAMNICKIMSNIFKHWDNAIYYEYMKKFNLPSNKRIKEFSRGMKMKLCLSVALSHQPKFLVLDEAMSGLDPVVRNEILDVFLEFIQDEEKSILISSHITGDLEKISDYISFIHHGKIAISGPKDDILEKFGLLKCSMEDLKRVEEREVVGFRNGSFGCEALVKDKKKIEKIYPNAVIDNVTLEDIMLYYVRGNEK